MKLRNNLEISNTESEQRYTILNSFAAIIKCKLQTICLSFDSIDKKTFIDISIVIYSTIIYIQDYVFEHKFPSFFLAQ
jgi:hypothetical protein